MLVLNIDHRATFVNTQRIMAMFWLQLNNDICLKDAYETYCFKKTYFVHFLEIDLDNDRK